MGRIDRRSPNRRLNVAAVYEDVVTRQWATEIFERVEKLAGAGKVRGTWWRMSELSQPAVLAGAVSTAMRASMLIVAIRGAERFPLPFYVWVDSWLPYYRQSPAALVALIAKSDRPTPCSDQARDYLRAVARHGRLDFLAEERKLEMTLPPRTTSLESTSRVEAKPKAKVGRTGQGRRGKSLIKNLLPTI
jgi:hypothetical protein